MRIALVHPFTWPNTRRGGERYLHDLAWYLDRAGHEVVIISAHGGPDAPGVDTVEGIEVRRGWKRPGPRARRFPQRLVDVVETRRIRRALGSGWDVVHALWPTASVAAAAAGFPTVYTLLGMPTPATREAEPALLRSLGRGAAAADAAGALSTPVRVIVDELIPAAWTVLPPGVRVDRFPVAPVPAGPPTVLFSASLSTRYKGLHVVLAAFARVLDEIPDAELVLSGAGSPEWAFETLAPDLRERVRAHTRVAGTGTLDEADSLYAEASVMVLPSRDEAFGLSVVEALATGCPVVVADHGGPSEIVGDAPVGSCVPVDDDEAVAQAIVKWIGRADDPSVRSACRARAMDFDWEQSVGPLHDRLYEAICVR
ncbi:glycosyltransferase family 4 protein [Actinospongicola halichondriae]|uniref:glycosyltransferase family 4 protein n=1 Tax=Actinospongicola halichondriae TaxID=3236844 RepID=UPI003D462119